MTIGNKFLLEIQPKVFLLANYHFKNLWIVNNTKMQVEQRLLVIRKIKTKHGTDEINFSFTNANLEQYTEHAIAYSQVGKGISAQTSHRTVRDSLPSHGSCYTSS